MVGKPLLHHLNRFRHGGYPAELYSRWGKTLTLWIPGLVGALRFTFDPPETRRLWFVRDASSFLMSISAYYGVYQAGERLLAKALPKTIPQLTRNPMIGCLATLLALPVQAAAQGLLAVPLSHWIEKTFFLKASSQKKPGLLQPSSLAAPLRVARQPGTIQFNKFQTLYATKSPHPVIYGR